MVRVGAQSRFVKLDWVRSTWFLCHLDATIWETCIMGCFLSFIHAIDGGQARGASRICRAQ